MIESVEFMKSIKYKYKKPHRIIYSMRKIFTFGAYVIVPLPVSVSFP